MIRSPQRRAAIAAAVLSIVAAGGACAGEEEAEPPASSSDSQEPTAEPEPKDARLRARVGAVTGELRPERRRAVARAVGGAVDRWFEAAWLAGDYPRTKFGLGAFPGFTREAAGRARADRRLLTNRVLGGRVDDVVARRREVVVDIFSPAGRPAGATARFRMVMVTLGQAERRVAVRGSLVLTPGPERWRITGYDVARDVRATKRSATKGEKS
ncbi:hypothetical protein [Nocardioides donggukensis]|uniref:SnoaL-like domain-containing protein n=1 Tax=Nocardioides donggukensis TaxID=2774019 RepID=A0A927Q300_9ACTN|nr:hypothetical protein [Nocardioides donggukensis]MBD8870121.1 hypothetical protein [Nocardioides donggukensis]